MPDTNLSNDELRMLKETSPNEFYKYMGKFAMQITTASMQKHITVISEQIANAFNDMHQLTQITMDELALHRAIEHHIRNGTLQENWPELEAELNAFREALGQQLNSDKPN